MTVTRQYHLGRTVSEDLRDLDHLMRGAEPSAYLVARADLPGRREYGRGPILDQGPFAIAVEVALEAKLRAEPDHLRLDRLPPRFAVYDGALKRLGLGSPGRVTSVSLRDGCKELRRRGLIERYCWAYDVDEITRWMLAELGGVVLGLDWYADMCEPNGEGLIRPTGRYLAGHAVYAYGVDLHAGWLLLQQSWGEDWGGWVNPDGILVDAGTCRLALDDLHRLLKGNGEAVAPLVKAPAEPAASLLRARP